MKAAWLFGIMGGLTSLCAGAAPAQAASAPASHPWGQPGCPCSEVLQEGTPAMAGLDARPLHDIDGTIARALVRRVFPGAVVLVARRGIIAKWDAYGYASIYTDGDYGTGTHPLPMPADEVRPSSIARMEKDEIFDLASVTKLFTAVAVMQLWDQGKFKLDDPVAKYLPGFGVNGKGAVTIRELLTHTSGFEPDPPIPLYDIKGTRAQRLHYVMGLPLEYPPRTHYVYSDINFIVLGALIEKLSGVREDVFIREHIAGPLHMASTGYNPPADLQPRIAATEYQPWLQRGMLRGQVEDGNAWALDGVSGHAGLFSSAHDLAVFGQMILDGGTYDGTRILSARAVELMLTRSDGDLPNARFPGLHEGLGWWLDMPMFVGALAGPRTVGHEGYTGTMLALDRDNDLVAIVLTNRVHPNRNGPSVAPAFRELYTQVADAIPVVPPGPGATWFAGYGDHLNRALTLAVAPHAGAELSFDTWYRIQPDADYGVIEASPDGEHWAALRTLTGQGDGWTTQRLPLPADARQIRFRYQTDASINGRGWYVHAIAVSAQGAAVATKTLQNAWESRTH